ncbi:DUF4276 family protein [Planctomycetota bacterium]
MTLRVVLYAEGGGEATGLATRLPAPGDALAEKHLGAGHVLLRRCLERERNVPGLAVRFEAPLRLRGRQARGGDLLDRASLRQLLTWVSPRRRPELAIVLVDCDGNKRRRELLEKYTSDPPLTVPKVIALAVQEFEAWLVADQQAVAAAIGATVDRTPDPESMPPQNAKDTLKTWLRQHAPETKEKTVRIEIAAGCDLAVVQQRCPAFERLLRDLRA